MSAPGAAMHCATCGRFRAYREGDRFCIVCGSETLGAACECGRDFGWVLAEPPEGALHCPRCGRDFRAAETDWRFR